MKTDRISVLAIALLLGICTSLAHDRGANSSNQSVQKPTRKKVYDGAWWLAANSEKQSGFLDGAGDCLTWVAHAKWSSGTPDQLQAKITQYYKANPAERLTSVTKVWMKLASEGPPAKPRKGGEVWTNPHWYYDGLWWRQSTQVRKLGFVEGYLWCLHSCVSQPSETFSRSAEYYVDKIWDYVLAHPKTADDLPIADMLSRYRDKPKTE